MTTPSSTPSIPSTLPQAGAAAVAVVIAVVAVLVAFHVPIDDDQRTAILGLATVLATAAPIAWGYFHTKVHVAAVTAATGPHTS